MIIGTNSTVYSSMVNVGSTAASTGWFVVPRLAVGRGQRGGGRVCVCACVCVCASVFRKKVYDDSWLPFIRYNFVFASSWRVSSYRNFVEIGNTGIVHPTGLYARNKPLCRRLFFTLRPIWRDRRFAHIHSGYLSEKIDIERAFDDANSTKITSMWS